MRATAPAGPDARSTAGPRLSLISTWRRTAAPSHRWQSTLRPRFRRYCRNAIRHIGSAGAGISPCRPSDAASRRRPPIAYLCRCRSNSHGCQPSFAAITRLRYCTAFDLELLTAMVDSRVLGRQCKFVSPQTIFRLPHVIISCQAGVRWVCVAAQAVQPATQCEEITPQFTNFHIFRAIIGAVN